MEWTWNTKMRKWMEGSELCFNLNALSRLMLMIEVEDVG